MFIMAKPTELYGHMLEKYRNVDEDEILSNLTDEQLQQLEGEIDREVLNKLPEYGNDEGNYRYDTTSDEYSSTSEEEVLDRRKPKLSAVQTKFLNRSLEKQHSLEKQRSLENQRSLEAGEPRRKSSRGSHQFKIPTLRRAKSRENLKRQKSEEGGELKKELMQAVKHRTKRRTSRANSSGIGLSRRYNRKNSSCLVRSRKPKVAKEEKRDANVNSNFITQEMLSLRPKLKKVKTREPAKVNDMLHGISLSHVTSGVKTKEMKDDDAPCENDEETEEVTYNDEDSDDNDIEEEASFVDEAVATANDDVHRRLNARRVLSDVRNDDTMSCTTAGSTSADSYDVIGELSINPNSVEETLLRIWDNDAHLIEVNLNNIQNVDMDVFEELASAMECNAHVKHLSLANVGLTDKPARALASMLKKNKTLEKLNVESNFISGDAALRVVAALRKNSALSELRIDNQRHIFGAKVEHEFSKILKDNKSLLRFGYQFSNPGPRMSASNTLTRNMDDVRKKRVLDQRKRAQASRPLLRHQPSTEWQRRERARRMQEHGLPLNLHGEVREEDVQNYLDHMDPQQFALLEQWFVSKFVEQSRGTPTQVHHHQQPKPGPKHPQHKRLNPPRQRVPSPRREPTPRETLLESIRNPRLTKPAKKIQTNVIYRPETPSMQKEQHPPCPVNVVPERRPPAPEYDTTTTGTSSSSTGDELIPWKDGDDYDSDLYDMVELEVSENDENSSENNTKSVEAKRSIPSESPSCYRENLNLPNESETSSGVSSWSGYERKPAFQDDVMKPFNQLQIDDRNFHPENFLEAKSLSPSTRKRLNCSPVSSTSSAPSLSPSSPRKVRNDDSWISRNSLRKLGTK